MGDRGRVLALVAVGAIVLAGCTSEPPDPAEERRDRAAERLDASFSGRQSACILDRLEEATLVALDATGALAEGSDELADLSEALQVCVLGEPEGAEAPGG